MNYKQQIAQLLHALPLMTSLPELDTATLYSQIENPERTKGDFAFPCFRLAKVLKQAPPAIAAQLATAIPATEWLEQVVATGPYLNFFVNKAFFAETVLSQAITAGNDLGKSTLGAGKNVVIDYSSPNIAKPFHVGHLRSTVIGQALYNIHQHLGYNCIGVNHLGDWGTQFGKLIVAYRLWSSEEEIKAGGIPALNSLYVRFHEAAKTDPSLDDQARQVLLQMEQGHEADLAVWRFFNEISLQAFEQVYNKLGITFDHYTGESFYQDKMNPVLDELDAKGLIEISEGARVVNLEAHKLGTCLVLRADGGTLYHTRDLATAFYRKQTFDFHKVIYVTASDQDQHFKQLFKMIELMGYDWSADMYHVNFGLVSLDTGKLSTRNGNVVLMDELIDNAIAKVADIINEKNPTLANKATVAEDIGIGAIIFHDLYNQRIKDIVFSFDKMLNFEGETGPFVQYAHARATTLLNKAGVTLEPTNIDFTALMDPESQNLLFDIYLFGDKIQEAANRLEPYLLSRHLVAIASHFNKFYQTHKIMDSTPSVKHARLILVHIIRDMLRIGLGLLGIQAPEQM